MIYGRKSFILSNYEVTPISFKKKRIFEMVSKKDLKKELNVQKEIQQQINQTLVNQLEGFSQRLTLFDERISKLEGSNSTSVDIVIF